MKGIKFIFTLLLWAQYNYLKLLFLKPLKTKLQLQNNSQKEILMLLEL